jgi:hypothetical protein
MPNRRLFSDDAMRSGFWSLRETVVVMRRKKKIYAEYANVLRMNM